MGLAVTIFSTTAMAQKDKKYKVIKRTLESDIINVPADSLWAILREFDKVGEWTSTLHHSEGAGKAKFEGTTCNERVCQINNNRLVEELTLFSDDKKELAYELTEGAPGFVKLASNHWTVYEMGPHQSVVRMDVTMHLSKFMGFLFGGILKRTMTKQVSIVLRDLKIYAETGEVSEAKKKQLAKLSGK